MDRIIKSYCREADSLLSGLPDDPAACFTGHRFLPRPDVPLLRALLRESILEAYTLGFRTFYCGAALGFDLLAGQEVLALRPSCPGLRLALVIPCEDQNRYWPEAESIAWRQLKQAADQVIVKSPVYYAGCMQVRNRYMVDHSRLCICYQEHFSGGAFSTVRYAQRNQVPVLNLSIPLMKIKAGLDPSSLQFRETPSYGTVYSYSLLRPKMPLLRFRVLPGPAGRNGGLHHPCAAGGRAAFRSPSRTALQA